MDAYIGVILPSAFTFAPYGTQLCHGQSISVSQNQAIYSLISNIYGGNTANINLPNLQGRVPIGAGAYSDTYGTANYALGAYGGLQGAKLSIANMPVHNHAASSSITSLGVTLSNITATASGTLAVNQTAGTTNVPGGSAGFPAHVPDLASLGAPETFYGAADGTNSMPVGVSVTVNQPTIQASGGSVSTTIGNAGSGTAFGIMQPYLAINYFIFMLGLYPTRD